MQRVFIHEMTWTEIEELLPKVKIGLIPTGSTEQHGPHLPLQTDMSNCLYICEKAAMQVFPTTLITPAVAVGISIEHMRFAGSLTLTPETFINVIYEIAVSLKQHGIEKIAIVNGHGTNIDAIKVAARKIYRDLNPAVVALSYWDLLPEEVAKKTLQTYPIAPGHACEFETSLSYVTQPELMRKDAIPRSDNTKLDKLQRLTLAPMRAIDGSSLGVPSGDPRLASREKGERLISALVEEMKKFLLYFAEHGDNYRNGSTSLDVERPKSSRQPIG